jgi:hypothetical protein
MPRSDSTTAQTTITALYWTNRDVRDSRVTKAYVERRLSLPPTVAGKWWQRKEMNWNQTTSLNPERAEQGKELKDCETRTISSADERRNDQRRFWS